MSFEYPDLPKRFEAVKDAVKWASGFKTVWIDQDDGGRIREPNEGWCELQPRRFSETGVGEIRHRNLETALTEGTLEQPRQEVHVSWFEIYFAARFRSRSQWPVDSAWYAGVKFKSRIRSTYPMQRWLRPNVLALSTVGDVENMPEKMIFDDRNEDLAIIEFTLNTALCETDETALGTWIDRCEVSSDLKVSDDVSLGAPLQLDDRVMGWPRETLVFDGDGTPITDNFGNFVEGE